MANKNVFTATNRGKLVKTADTVNEAGGRAYQLSHEEALAQMATTGTVSDTFYADAQAQRGDRIRYVALSAMDCPEGRNRWKRQALRVR